ncbi:MAG TPA: PH domain-containing protein [Syntrophomonadaceae bacterium]|nr:PH domain-containing protein [Syntrophomonadaceae bacterium]
MSKAKRLHPAAVIEILIKNISRLIKIIIGPFVVIASSPLSKKWLLVTGLIGLLLYVIVSVLSWLRFHYTVHNDELRIEQGIFSRHKTYIPLERIQSVQISAGIVQRIFALVKLEVQTAGGSSQAEATLSAISKKEASRLQNILQLSVITPDSSAVEAYQYQEKNLGIKNLIIAATTSNGIGVVLLGGLALLSQVNQYIPDEDIYTRIGNYLVSFAGQPGLIYLLAVFLLFLFAWLLSIIGTVISIGGFSISRLEDRLLVERGLIEKRQISIPLHRIQAVKVSTGIIRQPFGLAAIHVISAGHGDKGSNETLIFPLLTSKELFDFLHTFLPEYSLEKSYIGLSRAARNRYRMILTIPTLLLVLPIVVFLKYGFLALFLPALSFLWGLRQFEDAGWNITNGQLSIRYRTLGLKTFLLRGHKVQTISLEQNPWQRRKNLKALSVMIASKVGGTKIGIKGIDEKDGDKILTWFRGQ